MVCVGIVGWCNVSVNGKYVCVVCGGKDEKREPIMEFYCTREMRVVFRVVRKDMGVLFWTMPWYSRSEINFRVTESRCACSLIFGTSSLAGSVSCILRKMILRLISCTKTRMQYWVSLSDILSKMAGWGLLYMISLGVSSIRAVYSWVNCAMDCVRASPNSAHNFSA